MVFRLALIPGLILLPALAVAALPSTAQACGGTFCDGGAPTPMPVDQSGENILFIVEDAFVEAHIQIQYMGDPDKFGWVIPLQSVPESVAPGSDPLFRNLLAGSVPTYGFSIQNDVCDAPSNEGDGLGTAAGAGDEGGGSGGDDGADGGVDVLLQERVGAFEFSVIESDSAEAITMWLDENDYQQDPEAEPILQEYIDEGHVFGAVKLTAGAGVEEIHPIALRFQSDEPCVPLRLTRIAAVDNMEVRTFFLGGGRVVPRNYRHVEVNPLQIDWPNQAANYKDVISFAVDEKSADGRAFVTEYAGPSDVVSRGGILDPRWDADVFAEVAVDDVIENLRNQGLWACGFDPNTGEETCGTQHPLLDPLLAQYLPVPEGLDPVTFYDNLESHADQIDQEAWDGPAFSNAMQERIVQPGVHANELLDRYGYLTRMYTTISPHEMTADPMFYENAALPEVPALRIATQRILCNGDSIWILPDGREVYLPSGAAWPDFDDAAPVEEPMAYAELIEEVPEAGAPMRLVVNTEAIDAQLAKYNAAMGWNGSDVPEGGAPLPAKAGGCGCRAGGVGAGMAWLLCLGGFGIGFRRRR